ncbi:MAG: molybdopterin-dependent oxidoreductase [Promethearchaeota archaeon]
MEEGKNDSEKIIKIEGDDAEEPKQLRTCLRCRALLHYIYHTRRLKYPLKYIEPKGKGEFKRITWDEALEEISQKLKEVKEKHCNRSIFLAMDSGSLGAFHYGMFILMRSFTQFGKYFTHLFWNGYSYEL